METKRIFDVLCSLIGIFCLSPIFLLLMLLLKIESGGPVFYRQVRAGLNRRHFDLIKFRTMFVGSDKAGLLTIGNKDSRITRVGFFLRKYKIDELPQLFNILKGDMSFVGPRPEVLKYVEFYNPSQERVLSVKPGITDWASIKYINECELLAAADDPEIFYIDTIMPAKIIQNLEYIDHNNLWIDLMIISSTLKKIFFK